MTQDLDLDGIENGAIRALLRSAVQGDVSAARAALAEVDRVRSERLGDEHRKRMAEIADDSVALAAYLGSLGVARAEMERRIGHRITEAELEAWERASDDRILEVRAIELQQMRRGSGKVPTWATRKA